MTRTLAFPGAEGYGAGALGGAYAGATPTIYRVTNTDDSGPGSLRAAMEASGRRIVVFNTGGTITLSTSIVVTNPYLTILGQTAPADSGGITLKNGGDITTPLVHIKASEVIIRYLRFRAGPADVASTNLDCFNIGNVSASVRNVIVDHCSFSWSVDELVNVWYDTRDVTFQWCIFAEPLHCSNHIKDQCHSKGPDFGNASGGQLSFHHNLIVNSVERNPLVTTGQSYPVEITNNVIYNCYWGTMPKANYGAAPRIDIVGNYYKAGPETNVAVHYEVEPGTGQSAGLERFYLESNIGWHRTSDTQAEDLVVTPAYRDWVLGSRQASPTVAITETTAAEAYADVINHAGCRIPTLDDVDVRVLNNVAEGTGAFVNAPSEVGGWPTLAAGTGWTDTDTDGIPDSYETEQGGSLTATDAAASEYLWIEEWANSLTGGVITPGGDEPATGYTDVQVSASFADLTITEQGEDDPESPGLFVGHFDANEYNAWACIVFQNVQIAQGYTVSEAWLRVNCVGVNTAVPSMTIVGEDTDTAALFDGTYTDAFDRYDSTPTTATVAWTPDGALGWAQVNIASIINEITGRAGWSAGNNISIAIQPTTQAWSSQARYKIRSYDGDPNLAPVLRYSTPQSGGGAGATVEQILQVSSSNDDGYTRSSDSDTNLTATTIYVGDYDATQYDYRAFARFTLAYDIPDGSTVDAATIELYATGISNAIPPIVITAIDAADPTHPADQSDYDGRSLTTASVTWTPATWTSSTWYESSDIAAVIQELVDTHSGLSAGDHIVIMLAHDATGYGGTRERVAASSYDNSSSLAPKLNITHTEPGSGILLQRTLQQPLRVGMRSGMRI